MFAFKIVVGFLYLFNFLLNALLYNMFYSASPCIDNFALLAAINFVIAGVNLFIGFVFFVLSIRFSDVFSVRLEMFFETIGYAVPLGALIILSVIGPNLTEPYARMFDKCVVPIFFVRLVVV